MAAWLASTLRQDLCHFLTREQALSVREQIRVKGTGQLWEVSFVWRRLGTAPAKLLKCTQVGVLQPEESMPIRAAKHQSWTLRCESGLCRSATYLRQTSMNCGIASKCCRPLRGSCTALHITPQGFEQLPHEAGMEAPKPSYGMRQEGRRLR